MTDEKPRITIREDGMAEWVTPSGQTIVAPVSQPGDDWMSDLPKASPGIWDTEFARDYLSTLRGDDAESDA